VAETPGDIPKPRKPRWYTPTPAKFLFAVLVMQGVLFLSAHYRWFWFNNLKGCTVLIAVAATAIALLLLAGFVVVGRLFKTKLQFTLATLMLMVPVMASPCAWLAREMELARCQREAIIAAELEDRWVSVVDDWLGSDELDPFGDSEPTTLANRLSPYLGDDFFRSVDISEIDIRRKFKKETDGILLRWVQARPDPVDAKDDFECTALHYAALYGRIETANWLITHGADVNAGSFANPTPIHWAQDGAMARLLISAGADLTKQDVTGRTPLHLASQEGRTAVCEAILATGFPVDPRSDDPEMVTPLCNAVREDEYEVAKLLCRAGADCNTTGGKFYPRLLDYALSNCDQKMIDLLIENGAKASEDHGARASKDEEQDDGSTDPFGSP
jgi:hypothetical protein